jgi:transglutaminase-like putative cysteine protease
MAMSLLRRCLSSCLCLALVALLLPRIGGQEAPAKKEPPKDGQAKSRTFLFTYSTTVTGLPEGKTARIWLPVPSSGPDQDIAIESTKDLPKGFKISDDQKASNRYLYVEAKPNADGEIPLAITYKVTRREVKGTSKDTATAEQIARWLQADARVPIEGKAFEEIKEKLKLPKDLPKEEMAAARLMYDLVNRHMTYGKPKDKPWGNGDSLYAADVCVGNCSDFHSLFITLARSQRIPAKFEIGFPLPPERGSGDIPGYHCWAKFQLKDGGWVPVDISEANKDPKMKDYYFGNLTEDRVAFSTGRDLELVPKQDGPPVNFFVYPYVEVDGKPYAADKIKRKFTYKDQ